MTDEIKERPTLERIYRSIDENLDTIGSLKYLSDKIEKFSGMVLDTLRSGGKVLICGNGGSAADAQHFAAEFVGRFEKQRKAWPVLSLTTDSSCLTSLTNDYGHALMFSRQVEAFGQAGDLLIAISTSGESMNVLVAADKARQLGMAVVGMTGSAPSTLKNYCDLALQVPHYRTPRIQEAHEVILHIVAEIVENTLYDPEDGDEP